MVVPNPVDHLLRYPHPNSRVNALVQHFLRPIMDAAAVATPTKPVERLPGYFASKSGLVEGLSLLDKYLNEHMDPEYKQRKTEFGLNTTAVMIGDVAWALRGYSGIGAV